jgi:hypothetical protein
MDKAWLIIRLSLPIQAIRNKVKLYAGQYKARRLKQAGHLCAAENSL